MEAGVLAYKMFQASQLGGELMPKYKSLPSGDDVVIFLLVSSVWAACWSMERHRGSILPLCEEEIKASM